MSFISKPTSVFCRDPAIFSLFKRTFSAPNNAATSIAFSKDRKTIVCWHPETPFPYECSLPLPEKIVAADNTVLKVQATAALKAIHRPKNIELRRQELMNITHTTKHVWFPCNRKFKEKKTDMDRPYL